MTAALLKISTTISKKGIKMTQYARAHTLWSELKYPCNSLEGVTANDLKQLRFISY
jgi:hypothetical protein